MKQEKWEEQLRRKLADYEEPVPADLWAGIEASLPQRKSHLVVVWSRWIAVAAVFAGLIYSGSYLFNQEGLPMESEIVAKIETPKVGTPKEEVAKVDDPKAMAPKLLASEPKLLSKQQDAYQEDEILQTEAIEPVSAESHQEEQTPEHQDLIPQPLPDEKEVLRKLDDELSRKSVSSHSGIGLGLYAQNGFGNGMNSNGVLMSPGLIADYNYANSLSRSDRERIYLANYEERQKHYQPISFGLVANLPISSRFSLSSGLVYTRLRSDFTSIMVGNVQTTEQTLYYIGIPLSAQYRLWQFKGLKLYVSAGGQADYNLKAKQSLNGISQDISRDRWQFSVHGALGLEYDFIPQLGIYVEPGAKYYFDNGSRVDNYFKDKPLGFNLQLGLRLNLNE